MRWQSGRLCGHLLGAAAIGAVSSGEHPVAPLQLRLVNVRHVGGVGGDRVDRTLALDDLRADCLQLRLELGVDGFVLDADGSQLEQLAGEPIHLPN